MTAKAKFRLEGEDATAAAFRTALGNAQGTANRMSGLFKAAFAGISIAAVTRIGAQAIQLGDDLNKAAVKAGISGRAISELAHAAKMSDVELDALSTSIRKMQINLSEAASGGKAQKEALAALGIELADIKDLAADQQFERIAEQISRLKDPADRARGATELFGKAGADLLPMFEQGAAGIRKAREEAQLLGKSLSDETIKKLADADESVKRLKSSWESFAVSMTAKVAPSLSYFLEQITSTISGQDIERIRVLQEEIRVLQKSIDNGGGTILTPFISMGAAGGAPDVEAGIYTLEEQKEKLQELRKVLDAEMRLQAARGKPRSSAEPPGHTGTAAAEAARKVADKAEDDRIERMQRIEAANRQHLEAQRAHWAGLSELTQTGAEEQESAFERITTALDQQVAAAEIDFETYQRRWAYWQEQFDELQEVKVLGERTRPPEEIWTFDEEIGEIAKRGANSARWAFEDLFFDPIDGGLKGLANSFIDTIRRIVAEAAAAKLFMSKESGGFGWEDAIADGVGSLLGNLKGFATGGSFKVGGSGGVDSQVVAFKATPGEYVAVGWPGRGGGDIYQTVNIDARGSSVESVRLLQQAIPGIIKSAVTEARSAVKDDMSRYGRRYFS